MLFEFAMTPDVIEDALTSPNINDQYLVVELLMRLRENGLLVDLRDGDGNSYLSQLRDGTFSGYSEDIRSLLKDLFDRQRIVSHPASPNWISWLDEARYSKTLCSTSYGIILSYNHYCKLSSSPAFIYPFPPPPAPSATWTRWQGKRSKILNKCEADFRTALAPVLQHASRVDLVDPYFNCHRVEYQKTLRLCINLLGRETADEKKVVIHAGDPYCDKKHNPESPEKRLMAWETFFSSLSCSVPVTLKIFLWDNINHERHHNRYIFTNQNVGIGIQDGLDCHKSASASTDTWTLLDVDDSNEQWAKYTTTRKYRLLGKFPPMTIY